MDESTAITGGTIPERAHTGSTPENGWNEHFRFHYALEADILDAVRLAMASEGVILITEIEEIRKSTEIKSGSGEYLYDLHVRFTFTDGLDEITFTLDGQGADNRDKGIFKALTGTQKY